MTTIQEIINALTNTTKSTEKTAILINNSDNKIFAGILKWTYDKNINLYLNKYDELSKAGNKTIDANYKEIDDLLIVLSSRKLTGNAARGRVIEVLSCFDVSSQNIVRNIFKRDLRCNVGTALINKAFGKNFIPEFSVQLANTYSSTKKYNVDKWYATPKLDGIRAYWSSATPTVLYSRNGKTHKGMEHITQDINNIFTGVNITFIDGELYNDNIDFNDIQGAVTSSINIDIEAKTSIKYNIFALGSDDITSTKDMYDLLEKCSNINTENKSLNFIKYDIINNTKEEIEKQAKKYVCDGYEGIMLRDPNVHYEYKRSNALLKFKFFKESDLTITGFIEGVGKYSNSLGAITCKGKIDGHLINTEVGTGLTDYDRQHFWDNQDKYIGKLAEIKYQDISHNDAGDYSLRFPVFLKLKLDR